jgi:hypothetical protein
MLGVEFDDDMDSRGSPMDSEEYGDSGEETDTGDTIVNYFLGEQPNERKRCVGRSGY